MPEELHELLNTQQEQRDPTRQESRATQDHALAPGEMIVRTIPNLQVDKIMIRKKRNKSTQKVGEGQARKLTVDEQTHAANTIAAELRESA